MNIFKLGDRVRIQGLSYDDKLHHGIIESFDLMNNQVEIQWHTKEGKKTCPIVHHYGIKGLISFGPKQRSGHHLTNIFK